MRPPFVFGYGSLVNRATHNYAEAHPARILGWRRCWRHVASRDVAFLTAFADPECEIDGLIAAVPDADWPALDLREKHYIRARVLDVGHNLNETLDMQIYHAPPELHEPATVLHPVLLSYLDTVVQGFLREHGEAGVRRFFNTTDGWDAPISDDREAPVYLRHQRLNAAERALVDEELRRVGATIRASQLIPTSGR